MRYAFDVTSKPVDVLHLPAVVHQLDGQPIEQRLVARLRLRRPKSNMLSTSGAPKWRSQM